MILTLPLLQACSDAPAETGPPPRPPVPVQVYEAVLSTVPVRIPAVGSLQSPLTTTVAADISGIITFLDTPEGRRVEVGHLLARLDDSQANANVTVARAREQNARVELERVRSLHEKEILPRRALDSAEAEMETALGLLEEARTRLEKTYIRAPFTGVLGLRTAQLGQYVSSGDPIVALTQIDPLELVFSVPERHAPQVRVGQLVQGMIGTCGERFTARLSAIDPSIDTATRTLPLQGVVPNPEGRLRPGMSATVRLIVGELPEVVTVPQEAIVRQGTRYLVWILDETDHATSRPVEVGDFFVDSVHVTRGLQAGERVVTAGHQRLRPGAATLPEPYEPVENPLLQLGGGEGDCSF